MNKREKVKSFYQQKDVVFRYDEARFGSLGGHLVSQLELGGILSLLPQRKVKILDLGAGTGRVTKPLLERGFEVTAIDSSEEMVKKLKGIKNKKLVVKIGSAFSLPFKDESFDGVTALRFFDHFSFEDFKQILSEIKRVLKPEAVAVFNTLNKLSLEAVLPDIYSKRKHLNYYFFERELTSFFQKEDWKVKRIKRHFIIPRGFYLHLLWPMPRFLLFLENFLSLTPFSNFSACTFWQLQKK